MYELRYIPQFKSEVRLELVYIFQPKDGRTEEKYLKGVLTKAQLEKC